MGVYTPELGTSTHYVLTLVPAAVAALSSATQSRTTLKRSASDVPDLMRVSSSSFLNSGQAKYKVAYLGSSLSGMAVGFNQQIWY